MPSQPHSFISSVIFILPLLLLSLIPLFNMATKPSNNNLNGEQTLTIQGTIHAQPNQPISIFISTLTTYRASNSPQETSRPLFSKAHDWFLPRCLLSCGSRRWGQPRSRWNASNPPCSCFPPPQQPHPEQGLRLIFLNTGVLTKEFLDFSASRGNNLRSIGLEPGCKWCLCTARWKEAMEAAKGQDDPIVPKWVLFSIP